MKKSTWIKALVLLGMLAVLPPYFCLVPPDSGATATPDHIALTWTGDPATTTTLTWRTDSTVTSGFRGISERRQAFEESAAGKSRSS